MAVHGPSGAGKTYSALGIAEALAAAEGGRVAFVDTEKGSASKYSDRFDFDVMEVTGNYNPARVADIIKDAKDHSVLVIDSMTHFWNGAGGFLELVDEEVKKMKARGGKPDSFAAWKQLDPLYRRMIDAMLNAPMHIIFTLRAKMAYEKETGDNGKTSIKKVGMAPQMRDDFQYEFDVEGMLDMEHNLVIGKTRCNTIDGRVFSKPGKEFAAELLTWLNDGTEKPAAEPKPDTFTPLLERVKALATEDEFRAAYESYKTGKSTWTIEQQTALHQALVNAKKQFTAGAA